MGWSRITVNTAMLTTAIRINAGLETNIRAGVSRDQRFGVVTEILRWLRRPLFPIAGVDVNYISIGQINVKFFEAISRTPRCPPAVDRFTTLRGLVNNRHKPSFRHWCKFT